MKIKKSENTKVTFGEEAQTSVYACAWNDTVQVEVSDYDSNGILHEFELTLPITVARSLTNELAEDIRNSDEKKAKDAAEAAEEALNNDDTNS
jgi:hypothetical protein